MRAKILFIFLILFFIPLYPVKADATPDLRGSFLLQVENRGKLWYVEPLSNARIYISNFSDLKVAAKKFGLGIKNKDLATIAKPGEKAKNLVLAKRLSGRILLQVEGRGEAWYINPRDYKKYYLGDENNILKILSSLSLGALNKVIEKIPVYDKYANEFSVFDYQKTTARGMNINSQLIEKDIADFSRLEGNLLRVGFAFAPLMDKTAPYDFNRASFNYLDNVISWCEKYKIHVVIDPHTTPGTASSTNTKFDDKFWQDFSYHDQLIKLWEEIAWRYRDRGSIIAGYDLLNEPVILKDSQKNTPADYNLLVKKLIKAIREIDAKHSIIVELPQIMNSKNDNLIQNISGLDNVKYLEAPLGNNIVYEFHMYDPHIFTHQFDSQTIIPYPFTDNGEVWNKQTIINKMAALALFSKKYKAPVFMGEFSATRWTGDYGNQYLEDVIDAAEQNGWSWAYHAFRESPIWDAEMSNTNKDDKTIYASTPRLELLKFYFERISSLSRDIHGGAVLWRETTPKQKKK